MCLLFRIHSYEYTTKLQLFCKFSDLFISKIQFRIELDITKLFCSLYIWFLTLTNVVASESLPLGSLIWLASIICLFLLPVLPILNLKGTGNPERGRDHEIAAIKRVTTETPEKNINSGFGSVSFGKRCRGTRTRIKDLAILHAIEAS